MLTSSQLPNFIGTNFYNTPKTYLYNDAIYMCGIGHFDQQTGVYSKEGYLITNTAFFHHHPSQIKGQALTINPAMAKSFPVVEEAYFAGHLQEQYGHAITEFVSRIWAYKQQNLKMPILIRTTRPSKDLFSFKWLQSLLSLLDLKRSDFLITSTPIKIRNLTIPDPLFSEQSYCYKHMADFCHTIGDKAMSLLPEESLIKNSNIYLSRSQLVCGTILVDNEKLLEKKLQELGFLIIHPEDHSIAEQISFFRNNNIVTGIVGSAFHTSIFSPSPQGVALNMKGYPDVNYLTMDGVNNASIDYIIHSSIKTSEKPNNLYYSTKTIKDIEGFALDIYRLFQQKRTCFSIANMGKNSIAYKPDIKFYKIECNDKQTLKIDTRNSSITTQASNFRTDIILATLTLQDQSTYNFLVANFDTPLTIKYNTTTALAIPVIINKTDNGQFSLYIQTTNERFEFPPSKENLHPTYSYATFNYITEHKAGLDLVCSILVSIFDPNSYSNMEYYNNIYPEVVNSIFEIKNALHRHTMLTYDNCHESFNPLSNQENKNFLNGIITTHRSNIGDIIVKGRIDTGNSNTSPIEAIKINLHSKPHKYSIKYSTLGKDSTWTEWVNEGETAGIKGANKQLVGFSAKVFDDNQKEVPCICNAQFKNDDIIHSYTGGTLFASPDKKELIAFAVYLKNI